jgi:hypothetical protein
MEGLGSRTRKSQPGLLRCGSHRCRCSCRVCTSRSASALEQIFNAAATANCRKSLREFFTKCDEVERLIDGLSFRVDTQGAASDVELSLIHQHVLANPSGSTSSHPTARARHGALRTMCSGISHRSSVCIHSTIRLYRRTNARRAFARGHAASGDFAFLSDRRCRTRMIPVASTGIASSTPVTPPISAPLSTAMMTASGGRSMWRPISRG